MASEPSPSDIHEQEEWRRLNWRVAFDHMIHSDRAAVDIGIGAIQATILVNAGSLVALLAFSAQVLSKGNNDFMKKMSAAAAPFAFGLTASLIAFIIAYFYQSIVTLRRHHEWKQAAGISVAATTSRSISLLSLVTGALMIILTLASAVAFCFGALRAFNTFSSLK